MTANSTMQSLFEAKSTKNKNVHLQKLLSVFQILKYLSVTFYTQSRSKTRGIIKLVYSNAIIQKLSVDYSINKP